MNKTEAVSFWTPIVPAITENLTTKEWVRWQADQLLNFSHKIYRLHPNDKLKLEDAPVRSVGEIALQVALIASVVLFVAAMIIKVIDRYTHQYTFFVSSPPHSPLPKEKLPDDMEEEVLPPSSQQKKTPVVHKATPEPRLVDSPKQDLQRTAIKEAVIVVDIPKQDPQERDDDAIKAEEKNQFEEELKAIREKQKADLARELLRAEEEIKKKEAEERKVQEDAAIKRREEEFKKRSEQSLKCHRVAERIFPKMLAMFYRPDGELNNDYLKDTAYHNCWGIQEKLYPEYLRKQADKLEARGKRDEAEKCRKQAEENEKERKEIIDDMQPTLFPIEIEREALTSDQVFKDCTRDFTDQEFFHGTSKAGAELIKKEGFDPEWPAGNRILDTGYGAYLALSKADAEGYAKKAADGEGATLCIKVKTNGKFAEYHPKMFVVVDKHFNEMARLFARKNEEFVLKELEKEGAREPGDSVFSSLSEISYPLTNLFTRDFYARKGYRGVYAQGSDRAGCAYLNVFYPKEDLIIIQ